MYSNELICKILIYINENINNNISIDELTRKFNYNRYYLMKLFKKEVHLSIIDYINKLKIYHAIKLMQKNIYSFTRISIMIGFNSLEYFSRTFKKITGFSPIYFNYFFKNKRKLNDNQILKINKVIIDLYHINNIKEIYLNNRKSDGVKILSIFKKKY